MATMESNDSPDGQMSATTSHFSMASALFGSFGT
jgi:hypothetical protein